MWRDAMSVVDDWKLVSVLFRLLIMGLVRSWELGGKLLDMLLLWLIGCSGVGVGVCNWLVMFYELIVLLVGRGWCCLLVLKLLTRR